MPIKPVTRTINVLGLISLGHTSVAMAKQGYRLQAVKVIPLNIPGGGALPHPEYKGTCRESDGITCLHATYIRVGVAKALAVDPQIVDIETGTTLGHVNG